ncbi:hypothetical protein ABB02_01819 [Clostridiaceae bacterium JG1575]|nr:hypothetical protein ABB02_01819 [Clostridiaceae bacterium JG1575]
MKLHLGNPYWHESRPTPSYPRLTEDLKTQVVLVGGGMSGALLTYELTLAGFDVVTLDRSVPGYGSSNGNTGMIQYHSDDRLEDLAQRHGMRHAEDFYALSYEAMTHLDELTESLPEEVGYEKTSSLLLTQTEQGFAALRQNAKTLKTLGYPVSLLSREDLLAQTKINARGALRTRQDAGLNPFQLIHALLGASIQRGARVFQDAPVQSITLSKPHRILAQSHWIQSDWVLLATGYAPEAYPPIERAVFRNTTFSFMTAPGLGAAWGTDAMIWDDESPYLYFRKTKDDRLIAGGRDKAGTALSSRERIVRETEKIKEGLQTYWPHELPPITHRWQSVFGESRDGLPFIGADPQHRRLLFAYGYGGNGTCYSVAAALILRSILQGDPHPLAYTTAWPRQTPPR